MRYRLEQFYAAFGDRGVMFILFAFSVVVNSLLTVSISLPSVFPDEISVAGIAAFYSGNDWSGLMQQIGGDCGYIQALLYAPLFLVLKNSYALYKAMLVVNGILVSFIPLIAYHLAAKFGVMRVRFKLLMALCCGMYFSYLTSSKFIWNEAVTSLFGWLLVLCMFSAWDRKNRYTRFTMSLLAGFLCAVSYAADKKMLAVVLALVLTVLLSKLVFKEKIVNLPVFFISLIVSFGTEFLARAILIQNIWNGAAGTFTSETDVIPEWLGPTGNFFGVFFSHIYAFMTSTFGMGAVAGALFVVLIMTRIAEMIRPPRTIPRSMSLLSTNTAYVSRYSPCFSFWLSAVPLCYPRCFRSMRGCPQTARRFSDATPTISRRLLCFWCWYSCFCTVSILKSCFSAPQYTLMRVCASGLSDIRS